MPLLIKLILLNKIIVITSKEALVSQFIHGAYDARLKQILKNTTGFDFNIEYDSLDNNFEIPEKPTKTTPAAEDIIRQNFLQGNKPSGAQHFYQKQSLPLDEYKKPVASNNAFNSKKNPTLNKNYTFDNFVLVLVIYMLITLLITLLILLVVSIILYLFTEGLD